MTQSPGVLFERLLEIMGRLRGPGGCPWDRQQTPESLKPFLIDDSFVDQERAETFDRIAFGFAGAFLVGAIEFFIVGKRV